MTSFTSIVRGRPGGMLPGPPPFLVVPWEGIGLAWLFGVRSLDPRRDLKYDRSNLSVEVVKRGEVRQHLMTYAQNFPSSEFYDVMDLQVQMLTQMQTSSTLLSIEGNAPQQTIALDYVGKAGQAKMDVYTVERRTVSVAFRFVRYLDAAGEMKAGTGHHPDEAEDLVAEMNRLYMPSANVEIKLKSARPLDIRRQFGPEIRIDIFRQHIVPFRDGDADMTIFFVGKYRGIDKDPLGSALHDVQCIVVDDSPWQFLAPDLADQELNRPPRNNLDRPKSIRDLHVVLAHEIAHLLGVGHNEIDDNIMSNGRQDLKLNRQVVRSIKRL